MRMRCILLSVLLLAGAAGCRRDMYPETEVHALTEKEQQKARLDGAFQKVAAGMPELTPEWLLYYLMRNVRVDRSRVVPYVRWTLPEGLRIEGPLSDLRVYDGAAELCRIERLDGRLVFRFDDGTSYSVLSVLLTEPYVSQIFQYLSDGTLDL